MHGIFSLWHDEPAEATKQRDIDAARKRRAHVHTVQYERALQALTASYERAVKLHTEIMMHDCFTTFREVLHEARQQSLYDHSDYCVSRGSGSGSGTVSGSRTRLVCEEYERAMEAWASSNAKSLLRLVLSSWHAVLMNAAARQRALKAWTSSHEKSLVHYSFTVWHDLLLEVKERQNLDAKYECILKAWASSDVKSLVHRVFSSWRSYIICTEIWSRAMVATFEQFSICDSDSAAAAAAAAAL